MPHPRRLALLALASLALGGCSLESGAQTTPLALPGGLVALIDYPGAQQLHRSARGYGTLDFQVSHADLRRVFDLYDAQLLALGWVRTERVFIGDRAFAHYTRKGRVLVLEVTHPALDSYRVAFLP